MHAVVDTNIFVTALLRGALPRRVFDAFLDGQFTLLFSRETLAELIDVLTRPHLRVLMDEGEIAQLLALIQRDALIVHPTHHITICRDVKDNMFLECALAGADCLVTGDHDLLALHPFRGIPILRLRLFLDRLSSV